MVALDAEIFREAMFDKLADKKSQITLRDTKTNTLNKTLGGVAATKVEFLGVSLIETRFLENQWWNRLRI